LQFSCLLYKQKDTAFGLTELAAAVCMHSTDRPCPSLQVRAGQSIKAIARPPTGGGMPRGPDCTVVPWYRPTLVIALQNVKMADCNVCKLRIYQQQAITAWQQAH